MDQCVWLTNSAHLRTLSRPPGAVLQSTCQFSLQVLLSVGAAKLYKNIHQTIGAVLSSLFHNPPNSHIVLDPECGGKHRIRLFSPGPKSRATNYCWPDLAITQDGEIRLILEIEQTGIVSPARIGGKLLPVALSTYLCNEEIGLDPVSISREATLIQVVNTATLQPATRKLLQYENLEGHIRKMLPLGCIVRYFLFPVVADDAPPFGTAKYETLLDAINDSLTA